VSSCKVSFTQWFSIQDSGVTLLPSQDEVFGSLNCGISYYAQHDIANWNDICSSGLSCFARLVCFNLVISTKKDSSYIFISFWYSTTVMLDYEYVVYYVLYLAKVNVLSIQPWDKIITFFYICRLSCQYWSLFVSVSGLKHPRFECFFPMLTKRSFGHFGYVN
jgi:hypothetical protein